MKEEKKRKKLSIQDMVNRELRKKKIKGKNKISYYKEELYEPFSASREDPIIYLWKYVRDELTKFCADNNKIVHVKKNNWYCYNLKHPHLDDDNMRWYSIDMNKFLSYVPPYGVDRSEPADTETNIIPITPEEAFIEML